MGDDAGVPAAIPEEHPLAGKEDLLDTHEGHLMALSEVLDEADPDEVHAAMVVLSGDEGTDTMPTVDPTVDAPGFSWLMLAAHIHHMADTFDTTPQAAAKHAVHVLLDQQPGGGRGA